MKNGISTLIAILSVSILLQTGCRSPLQFSLDRHTGGNAFLYRQFQAYDGRTGRPLSFAQVVEQCRRADAVFFGEEHHNAVCNQVEAQLLYALLRGGRPWALALEFFEADTQESLSAYGRGRLTETAFLKSTKRRSDYLDSHRSLVELCRATRTPLIAANAPRRLVRAYRKSGQSYEEYRAGLTPEEQRWLPTTNLEIGGAYQERFAETMRGHGDAAKPAAMPGSQPASAPSSIPADQPESQPAAPPMEGMTAASQPSTQPVSQPAAEAAEMPEMPAMPTWQELFKAQLLWDQAMSESLSHARDLDPRRSVMLIVGGFHVAEEGGTVQKFRKQRPRDRVITIVYRSRSDTEFAFDKDDRGTGDIVIYGLTPEQEKPTLTMPVKPSIPPSPTATAPTEMPVPASTPTEARETPASAPAEMPKMPPDSQEAVG